jgi:hypothetical protein
MNADDIRVRDCLALIIAQNSAQIINGPEAITSEFKIVGHDASASIAEVKRGLLVEGMSRVRIRDTHVREGKAIEQAAVIVTDLLKW